MSGDLTRWNRAGRSQFEYIDGNAVIWLEMLREALNERFPHWAAVEDKAPDEETDVERLARLEAQYLRSERGDLLWEMTRTLARSCHILTEYIDAYANEGFLRTATQWDNVRGLVEMVDYHPAPPASASTRLVLMAKEDAAGEVPAGFQVKYAPSDGGAPVIFETLEAIEVDATLNELRLVGWDRSAMTLSDAGAGASLWVADEAAEGLTAGQVALLENAGDSPTAAVVEIDSMQSSTGEITYLMQPNQPTTGGWLLADLILHARATQIHSVLTSDERAVRLDTGHGLTEGDVIAWEAGGRWRFNRVDEADDQSIRLEYENPVPDGGTDVYKAAVIEGPATGDFLFAVDSPSQRVVYLADDEFVFLSSGGNGTYADVPTEPSATGTTYYEITDSNIDRIFIAPQSAGDPASPVGAVQEINETAYELLGSPGDLASDQWIAAQCNGNGHWKAFRIESITAQEDRFFLNLNGAVPGETAIERICGAFRYPIFPQGADENTTALSDDTLSKLDLAILSDADQIPELLVVGRALIIEQETDAGYAQAVAANITKVENTTISIDPPLAADDGFTRGNTVIRANVVLAGHGERQPGRVLGSGSATRINQVFEFANEGVSFVADTTMAAGVRADIDVSVASQTWKQVASLNDSGATDAHYSVRITEDGFLKVGFGDGEHGRRLPTGTNNVRIAWRKGTGLAGKLPAESLDKPVKPHRLLDAVCQPQDTTGGSDMESEGSLRENAPATLLTLQRAVSISDFKYLATSHSSVWQATAFRTTAGLSREELIEIVVVPAGGGKLGGLAATLQSHLQNHALPGVAITVSDYQSIIVPLQVTVRINSDEYDPDTVTTAVASALLEAFSLANRRLGQSLYRAELFEVVEAVEGVENSDCRIGTPDESGATQPVRQVTDAAGVIIKVLKPNARQMIHVASDGLGITVDWQEYAL